MEKPDDYDQYETDNAPNMRSNTILCTEMLLSDPTFSPAFHRALVSWRAAALQQRREALGHPGEVPAGRVQEPDARLPERLHRATPDGTVGVAGHSCGEHVGMWR